MVKKKEEEVSEEVSIYDKLLNGVAGLSGKAIEKADKAITRKGYDTVGYQYQFLVNVCNEVLGLDGWGFEHEIVKDIEGVWGKEGKGYFEVSVATKMWIKIDKDVVQRVGYGGHRADLHGDALKGASTNSLKKTMALFGIGKKAYEGTLDEDYTPIPEARKGTTEKTKSYPSTPKDKPATATKGKLSAKQITKLKDIISSRFIREKEKEELIQIGKDGDYKALSWWFDYWYGENFAGGERDKREASTIEEAPPEEEQGEFPY